MTLSKAAVRLKRILAKGEITQSELARLTGVSQQSVSKWLVAGIQPGFNTMLNLQRLFAIPLEEWAEKSRSPEAIPKPWFQSKAKRARLAKRRAAAE